MIESSREWVESMCISASHPSLAGHFPGAPVVAGVIVLDRLVALLERAGCASLRRIPAVKFRAPLLPEQMVELRVTLDAGRVRFRLARDGELLVSGEAELA